MSTRPTVDEVAPERPALEQRLDFLRSAVVFKARGLSTEDAIRRPIPSTDLTVAGLVKHLAGIERFWFSIDFAGLDVPWPYTDEDPHGNFPIEPGDNIETIIDAYEEECQRSRAAIDGSSLDDLARGEGMHFDLRYAMIHVIEETARHCGHLDLLREAIDGLTGE